MIDILRAWWGPPACPWCVNREGWFEELWANVAYRWRPVRKVAMRVDRFIGRVGLTLHERHDRHEPDPTCYGCLGTGTMVGRHTLRGVRCPCTYPDYWKEV